MSAVCLASSISSVAADNGAETLVPPHLRLALLDSVRQGLHEAPSEPGAADAAERPAVHGQMDAVVVTEVREETLRTRHLRRPLRRTEERAMRGPGRRQPVSGFAVREYRDVMADDARFRLDEPEVVRITLVSLP